MHAHVPMMPADLRSACFPALPRTSPLSLLRSCNASTFLTKSATEQLRGALQGFVATRDANAPGMFLNLEETATKSGGGCANMSGETVPCAVDLPRARHRRRSC
jgi:hypothetical protein